MPFKNLGGAEGVRTPDPLLAKQVLSQLSYSPNEVVGPSGIEPETSALSAQRSNQLSYGPRSIFSMKLKKWNGARPVALICITLSDVANVLYL